MPHITDETGKQIYLSDSEYVHLLFQNYQAIATEMLKFGIVLSVGGNGLMNYFNQLNNPMTAADVRAQEILKRLPEGNLVGAEIGVFAGELSSRLLQREDIKLTMVDSWTTQPAGDYADSNDFHATLTQEQQDNYFHMTEEAVKFAQNRAIILRMDSKEAAKIVDNESLDFVFIDADHSYSGCKADLEAWFPKVKKGGLFSGHDYDNKEYPEFGVKQAVDEFAEKNGLTIELGHNYTWFAKC